MAEIAVNLVIGKLRPLLSDEAKLLLGVHKEVAEIKDTLEHIRALTKDADAMAAKEDRSNIVKLWVKQVQEVAERIEDVIEEYKIRVAQLQPDQPSKSKGFLKKVSHQFKSLKHRREITLKIQNIRKLLFQIKGKNDRFKFKEQGSSSNTKEVTWHDPRLAVHFIGEAEVVGINDSIEEVTAFLVKGTSKLSTISVIGMGGIGKTTLAKKAFDNPRVKEHFDCRIWITVSQSYNMEGLLKEMIRQYYKAMGQTAPEEINTFNVISLVFKLRESLQNKRCVVVFDDVCDEEFWGSIMHVFDDDDMGTRIITTTRYYDVSTSCRKFSIVYIHEMQPLPPEKAMELFCKKAFKHSVFEWNCPPELEELSFDIVERCQGLPLAIVVIGGLLSIKEMIVSEWTSFLDNLSFELDSDPHLANIKKILCFSYHDLPYYLKSCFLYFGMYPEDYSIRCSRLIKQWIAEGFVKEDEKGNTLEEIANEYLSELIHRSLVQVSSVSVDGKAKHCHIHDLLHEFILSKTAELNFCQVLGKNDSSFYGRCQRLSINHSTDNVFNANEKSQIWDDLSYGKSKNMRRYRYPLSFLFIDTQKGNQPGELVGKFLHRGIANGHLLRLQILDLEHVYKPQLPENLGDLTHLIYLSLRWTLLEIIPSSIGKLLNLQTLDLKHTNMKALPSSIEKLQKLKHIYITRSTIRPQLAMQYLQSLKNLHTLKGLFLESYPDLSMGLDQAPSNHRKSKGLYEGLGMLINLRELEIELELIPSQLEIVINHVTKLKHLQSLKLTSYSATESLGHLKLESLSGLENLSRLELSGVIDNPSIFLNTNGLPKNLTRLTLVDSALRDDPIPVLQKLHNLRSLYLNDGSYTGRSIVCSTGGFPQLLVLKMSFLFNLEEVIVEELAMQKLMELEIVNCRNLEVLTGLKNLETLQQLKLTDMSKEFIATIEETKGKTLDNLAIIVSGHCERNLKFIHI